jgi:hypothetical protein
MVHLQKHVTPGLFQMYASKLLTLQQADYGTFKAGLLHCVLLISNSYACHCAAAVLSPRRRVHERVLGR